MISGRGFSAAKVMLVADGASDEDVGTGYAISGQQERVLRGYCEDHGIKWNELWLTALIKERTNQHTPDKNKHFLLDNKYSNILRDEITEIKPNIIVPLSELSFHHLTNLNGIRKFRGSVLPPTVNYINQPTRIIPILGPNPYLNEDPKMHFISRLDFAKVAKNIDQTGPIQEIGNCWTAKISTQLREFFERQLAKNPPFVIFDIESYYSIPTCISFCFDGWESVTAPLLDKNISLDDRVLMMRFVAKLLAMPIPKVNQNIKFDWKKLERFGFYVENVSGDTLLAASCLYCEFPKRLGFLTSLYTDMPYFKDEGKEFDPTIHNRDKLYLYCAKDSLATHQIYTQQMTEIKELGVSEPYENLIKILPIYKRAEERGIRIDDERRQKLRSKYETLFNIQVFKIKRLLNNYDLNPLSSAQSHKVVYEELGYKWIRGVKKSPKTGKASTDEDSLELLMWKGSGNHRFGTDILKCFINCRKLHKVLEYIDTPIHPDGRIRSEFNLGGSENARTTAGKSTDRNLILDEKGNVDYVDLGRSFQTIAKHGFEVDFESLGRDLRSMFVPSPGFCFVEGDLSGAEARVDAVLAADYDILPVFDSPTGIHRLTGSWIFGCPPEEIKKNIIVDGVERYYLAKTVRHAAERNIKEEHLMLMIHQPIIECRKVLATIHDKQPNIRKVFHKQIYEKVHDDRMLIAPNGCRRDFYGRFDYNMVQEAISFLPQAIVTHYLKAALRPLFDQFPDAYMLSEAHDGILAEIPLGQEKDFGGTFKKTVEVPIDFRKCSLSRDYELIIPGEIEVGYDNWMDMKGLEL